jgi:hypothetical protein
MTLRYTGKLQTQTVTIAAGASESSSVDLNGLSLVGIVFPSVIDNTTMIVEASLDNSTFVTAYNTFGNRLDISVKESAHIAINPMDLAGIRHVRLCVSEVEQAARTITFILRVDS